MSFLKESWLKRGDDLALAGKGPQNCPLEAVSQLSGVMSRGRLVLCLTALDSLYLVLISVGVSIKFFSVFATFPLSCLICGYQRNSHPSLFSDEGVYSAVCTVHDVRNIFVENSMHIDLQK